jgi:hypothetical protein
MGKKEKNTNTPKNKKLLDNSVSSELLTKAAVSSPPLQNKEADKQERDFYSKPIFKTKRFDLF